MGTTKEKNNFLYVCKAICCMLVVFIHCHFSGTWGMVIDTIARIGVPIFFCISGRYLLSQQQMFGTKDAENKIKKKLMKTCKTTVLVWGIYTTYSLVVHLRNGYSFIGWVKGKVTAQECINQLMYNSSRLIYDDTYVYDFMWYLFALIYVYVIVLLACHLYGRIKLFKHLRSSLWPTALVMATAAICLEYFTQAAWYTYRNYLFVGLPFFIIGYCTKNKTENDKKIDNCKKSNETFIVIILIIAALLLSVFEHFTFGEHNVYFGTLFAVLLIMGNAEQFTMINNSVLTHIGRNLSNHVYFWHVLVMTIYNKMCHYCPALWKFDKIKPLIVLSLTLILAEGIFRIKRRKQNKS